MQVSGSSCDVLAHAGSLIVDRMSHLSYPLPCCCHVHVKYLLSIDVQWVSCACNWIVFLCFLEAKACLVAKLVACFALVFFGWALEPFKMSRISTLATSILVLVSQSGIKALLVLVWRPLSTILLVCLLLLGLWFFLFVLAI